MRQRLRRELAATQNLHAPLPLHYEDMREVRDEQKTVVAFKQLDDFQNLNNWSVTTLRQNRQLIQMGTLSENVAQITLSDRYIHGDASQHSLRFTSPTRLPGVPETATWPGGIMCIPSARFHVDNEDWTPWNRLSCWVYTDMPGFHSPYLRIQFHNAGDHPVPDRWDREGHHNFNLRHGTWFHMTVEIPYLHRDQITGISFDYDMVGSEPTATREACWYISDLRLEKVAENELDHYSGWAVGQGRLAFSHSGYQTGSMKTAILCDPGMTTFRVFESETGRAVLNKDIQTVTTSTGTFQVLDFSEITDPGEYFIVCGDRVTRTFPINDTVWEDSLWKTLNFIFCERCGYTVPGKHYPCCQDRFVEHEGLRIAGHGGWHDAADMSQMFINTAEITAALFSLLDRLVDNRALYERVREEARWGLEWMVKTRFGNGFRPHTLGGAHWTMGKIGDGDDRVIPARNHCHNNFIGAGVEALGYLALREIDPIYAAYVLKAAQEDWTFAVEGLNEGVKTENTDHATSMVSIWSAAVWAGLDLYRATGDTTYKDAAKAYAKQVLACQQQQIPDWDIPLTGFFYREPGSQVSGSQASGSQVSGSQASGSQASGSQTSGSKAAVATRGAHRSQENAMMTALCHLCAALPDDPEWMEWYYGVVLYAENQKKIFEYTAPYYMAPCSVYHEDEIDWDEKTFIHQHAQMAGSGMTDEIRQQYADMLKQGVALGKGYYLRRFPVWYSFRGNHSPVLSAGKAAALAAGVRNDYALSELSHRQMEWITGKNPFAESLIFGEGYDYGQAYTVCLGETVGQFGVGMQTMGVLDEPFWPQVNTCTYKEVWVVPAGRWMWLAADNYGPAYVSGVLECVSGAPKYVSGAPEYVSGAPKYVSGAPEYMSGAPEAGKNEICFRHALTRREYRLPLCRETGYFAGTLPSGEYTVYYGGIEKAMTFVAGRRYKLGLPFAAYTVEQQRHGEEVTVTLHTAGSSTTRSSTAGISTTGSSTTGSSTTGSSTAGSSTTRNDAVTLVIRAKNLTLSENVATATITLGDTFTFTGHINDKTYPYLAVIIPNGQMDEKLEIFGSC